jgi:cell filamentation protein
VGRTGVAGRLFWDRVCRDAGWTLDWRTVSGRVNDHASRTASEKRDLKPLQEMFGRIAAPLQRADREVSARLSRLALRRDRGAQELGLEIQG